MPTKITNKTNLPEEFVRATQYDGHRVMGDISCTQLIDAPQIRILKRKHEIEQDVTDMIWALFGTSVHYILEKSQWHNHKVRTLKEAELILAEEGNETLLGDLENFTETLGQTKDDHIFYEKTLTVEVDGMTISGTIDKFDSKTGIIEDYKVCSVYKYIFPEEKQKWEAQQNVYAYMLRENGYKVNGSKVNAIFRDFSDSKSNKEKIYPKYPIMQIDLKLYSHEKIHDYIKKRLEIHRQADLGNIPECTPKERWNTPDTYAAKKPGNKRATKVFQDKVIGEKWVEANAHKYEGIFLETRKGENKRCDKFCPVKDVCPQRKSFLN